MDHESNSKGAISEIELIDNSAGKGSKGLLLLKITPLKFLFDVNTWAETAQGCKTNESHKWAMY